MTNRSDFTPGNRVSSFQLEVSRGNVPGMATEHKFGRNADIDTATVPEDIWDAGGVWVPPTTTRTHQIVSTDTNDTSAGTGARTVFVEGLDSAFAIQTETVTMNGTTNVPTASTYTIIHRMMVITAGSGAANAGTITATADTDATVTAQITIGMNQTLMAIYQVPAGKKGYIENWYATVNGGVGATSNGDVLLLIQPDGEVYQVKNLHGLESAGSSHFNHVYVEPIEAGAKSIIKVQVNAVSANNTDISGGFDLILVDQ